MQDVKAGKDFSMTLSLNSEVFGCGANGQGQLGLGDTTEMYCEPMKIPGLQNVKKIDCCEGTIALR